eukprot:GGOE01024623.1.p1 GENE.GGOE01024623.1~~GGOE01024623.1.p1  ORF type:complete len:1650 (-),score=409.15 GGOE01024623.1:274-4728(-)
MAPRTDMNIPPEKRHLVAMDNAANTNPKGAPYDEVREEGFKALLNFCLCESPDLLPPATPRENLCSPTPGDSLVALARCRVKAKASGMLRSLGDVLHRVGHAVDSRAVVLSGELLTEGRRPLAQTLMSYHAHWLQLGLETLFDTTIGIQAKCKRLALHRLSVGSATDINDRCLDFLLQYVVDHPDSPNLSHLCGHVLRAVCMLVLLLDRCSSAGLLHAAPPLFRPDSPFKSSKALLRFVLATYVDGSAEDAWSILSSLGYELCFQQSAVEEVAWSVGDVPLAVADGVRVARLLDLWLCPRPEHRLQNGMQPSATHLQQRAQWKEICDTLRHRCALDLEHRGVRVADVQFQRPQQTYSLLWLLTLHVLIPQLAPLPDALQEWGASSVPFPSDSQLYVDQPLLQALLGWVNRVCATHGVIVRNFTASFADGRAFCMLIASYCPSVLPMGEIRAPDVQYQPEGFVPMGETEATPGAWSGCFTLRSNPEEEAVRRNFRLLRTAVALLGGIPLLIRHRDFVNGRCGDERLTATFVAFLFQRLREVQVQQRAAVAIQRRWQAYCAATPHRTSMAVRLQAAWRSYWGRKCYQQLRATAMHIQSLVRMWQTRRSYGLLRRATLLTQTLRRKTNAYHFVRALRQQKAATRIQRWTRQHQQRTQATVQLQALWRGVHQRREFCRQRQALCRLQATVRARQQQARYQALQWAATKLQSSQAAEFRRTLAYRLYVQLRVVKAAVVLQSNYRMHLAMLKCSQFLAHRSTAAIQLQRWWQSRLCRHRFLAWRLSRLRCRAAIRLQLAWRTHLASAALIRLEGYCTAAVAIQRAWRARLVGRLASHSACCISQVVRAWMLRRHLQQFLQGTSSRCRAAVVFQALQRGRQCRKALQRMASAACVIQRAFRSHQQQTEEKRLMLLEKRAAVANVIICFWRARKQRQSFLKQRQGAIRIQALWRGHRVRATKFSAETSLERWKNSPLMSHILAAVKKLERSTNHSFMVRRMVARAGVIHLLVDYIRSSNKSAIGGHLMATALRVLHNLSLSSSCLAALWKEPLLVPALCDCLSQNKENHELFAICLALLQSLMRDKTRFVERFSAASTQQKLQRLADYYSTKIQDTQRTVLHSCSRSSSSALPIGGSAQRSGSVHAVPLRSPSIAFPAPSPLKQSSSRCPSLLALPPPPKSRHLPSHGKRKRDQEDNKAAAQPANSTPKPKASCPAPANAMHPPPEVGRLVRPTMGHKRPREEAVVVATKRGKAPLHAEEVKASGKMAEWKLPASTEGEKAVHEREHRVCCSGAKEEVGGALPSVEPQAEEGASMVKEQAEVAAKPADSIADSPALPPTSRMSDLLPLPMDGEEDLSNALPSLPTIPDATTPPRPPQPVPHQATDDSQHSGAAPLDRKRKRPSSVSAEKRQRHSVSLAPSAQPTTPRRPTPVAGNLLRSSSFVSLRSPSAVALRDRTDESDRNILAQRYLGREACLEALMTVLTLLRQHSTC